MITIEGTVIDILGYPATPFTVVAKMPATKAPAKAATAGGKDARSISSNRNVLDTAPITPAAAASLIGLLKRMENPNTPPKLASRRNMIQPQCKFKLAEMASVLIQEPLLRTMLSWSQQ